MTLGSVEELIKFTFIENGEFVAGEAFSGRMILALRHVEVNEVNNKILEMLPGEILESRAVNTPAPMNAFDVYQGDNAPENLDISIPGSLPEHLLRLKKGAVVFCMVNAKQQNVYNSTLLLVEDMTHYLLHCRILTRGKNFMEHISLSKFNMEYQDLRPNDTHYHFFRQQFPVRLAFALTINKSQSQTLQRVGLYLRQQVFSPGHLYVAFSRVTRQQDVKIFAPDSPVSPNGKLCVRNVVAKDLIEAVEKNDRNFLNDIGNMRVHDEAGVENSLNSSFEVNLDTDTDTNEQPTNLGNMNIDEELYHINEDTDDLENAEGERIDLDDPLDEEMGIPDYTSHDPTEFDPREYENDMGL